MTRRRRKKVAWLFFFTPNFKTMPDEILRLPIRFNREGFVYYQLCRTDKAAIYEQRTTDGRRIFYEVWRIHIKPSHTFNGREYGTREVAPSGGRWGVDGWTFYRLPDAQKRYELINGNGIVPRDADTRILSATSTKA